MIMLQAGHYLWKTYKEIYEEVLNAGSALQQLGAQRVSHITLILVYRTIN